MNEPKQRMTADQMRTAADAGSGRITICPQCGGKRFYATNTYYLVDGLKRRLRQCFACGFARNESVPEPIPD